MSGRNHIFLTNNIYHIYNKTIEQKRIFADQEICKKFLDILTYYRSSQSLLRYSNFQNLSSELKIQYEKRIFDRRTFRISILSYCLMPTHFHLLIKQKQENGISFFISQILNSFTRYRNIKNERVGPIFLHPFKSKYIQTEEEKFSVAYRFMEIELEKVYKERELLKNSLLDMVRAYTR